MSKPPYSSFTYLGSAEEKAQVSNRDLHYFHHGKKYTHTSRQADTLKTGLKTVYLNFVMGAWWANLPGSLYPTVNKCSGSVARKKTEWLINNNGVVYILTSHPQSQLLHCPANGDTCEGLDYRMEWS